MKIRDATILLVALIGVICCGPPQHEQVQVAEEAVKMEETIENLKVELAKSTGVIRDFMIPRVTISYYSKTDCTVVPYELEVIGMKVKFVNDTDVDVTFTFPNAIFDPAVFTVAARTTETKELTSGASGFESTDYAVESRSTRNLFRGRSFLFLEVTFRREIHWPGLEGR